MTPALLDVNVLLALFWPTHVHHAAANRWFRQNAASGWVTCPMTECGFVRISSNPRIIQGCLMPQQALQVLRNNLSHPHHIFWADDFSLKSTIDWPMDLLVSHRQVTDAYLLSLAIHKGGRLATLDRRMSSLLATDSPHHDALVLVPVE